MGFKRTSEGRIFFSGANEMANDQDGQPSTAPQKSQVAQLQILTLLKGLNERLKTTQAERNQMRKELNRYRDVIEELEEKAEKSEETQRILAQAVAKGTGSSGRAAQTEQMARDTLSELEETRKLLLQLEEKTDRTDRGVNALKTVQQDQARKMANNSAGYAKITKRLKENEERQDYLGDKIEESISQQARLVRKIDKGTEDRARFMRKIERIEEAVLQTQDSLNAKAMVLLTDQSAAAKVALEDQGAQGTAGRENAAPEALKEQDAKTTSIWSKSFQMQPVTMAMFLVAVLLAGWALNEMRNKNLVPDLGSYSALDLGMAEEPELIMGRMDAPPPQLQPAVDNASESYQPWRIVEEDSGAFSETAMQRIELGEADDIGTVTLKSDAELVALLDSRPNEVAATLNTIEPGSNQIIKFAPPPPQSVEETIQAIKPKAELRPDPPKPAQIATAKHAVEPKPVVETINKAPPISSPRAANIPKNIKPDASLPSAIKDIEAQAFNGVPEAQHDLAAVYTAGHAGVRQDYKRAAFWFKKAADNGIANAAYNLGVLNHQGLGVATDTGEAILWYQKAAKLGHPEAQYNLGIAYIEGIGVKYDPARASKYFEDAAGQGIMEAAYNLGLIHENGLLGSAKPDEALVWYKTAADQGSPEAQAALAQLAKTLGIGLDDVNRLAEGMKAANNSPVSGAPSKEDKPAQAAKSPHATAQATTSSPAIIKDPVSTFVAAGQEQAQMMVAQIQEYLINLGLYPGPADGVVGPLTSDAIRSYQSINGLSVDGAAKEDLLSHMLANSTEHINWNDEASGQGLQ